MPRCVKCNIKSVGNWSKFHCWSTKRMCGACYYGYKKACGGRFAADIEQS